MLGRIDGNLLVFRPFWLRLLGGRGFGGGSIGGFDLRGKILAVFLFSARRAWLSSFTAAAGFAAAADFAAEIWFCFSAELGFQSGFASLAIICRRVWWLETVFPVLYAPAFLRRRLLR